MKSKTGGAAFPTTAGDEGDGFGGMTLRDYFAAESPVSIEESARYCRSCGIKKPGWRDVFAARAKLKFMDADAMLKARDAEPEDHEHRYDTDGGRCTVCGKTVTETLRSKP